MNCFEDVPIVLNDRNELSFKLLLINSLLSNPDNDIHYMQYIIVKDLASHRGL